MDEPSPTLETISHDAAGLLEKPYCSSEDTRDPWWVISKPVSEAWREDLWKEYQTLESTLELRTKTLDRLETMARSAIPWCERRFEEGDGEA